VCGIAGVAGLGSRPVPPDVIKKMCDSIAHRGPDDAGYVYFKATPPHPGERGCRGYWTQFADPAFRHQNEHLPVYGGGFWQDEATKLEFGLAMGHRRLAIIDLTHYGHQPMASPDRRFWVTFNGEVYNYRELRADLETRGHVFRTRTDTEVLLHLWEEEGHQSLARLDGMFAFAIYDSVTRELTLARDRFGVKPVYWAATPEFFLFGSEVKALLASGLHTPAMDPDGIAEYFTFQNRYGDGTLFNGVRILPPGHALTVRPSEGGRVSMRAFHSAFPTADPALAQAKDLHEQVASAFSSAVTRQLVSDVEVGSYLSGGMDSGSIVAVAGRSIPRLHTFTCGFDLTNVDGVEQGFDERELAEKLSYLLQTEHYDVVLHAGDMPAAMPRISWHMDDPRVGMCHQNWYAAKLASKFVKVCLAGAGGDELFGGYPWRYRPALQARNVEEFDENYLRYWHRLLGPEELPALFMPELRRRLGVAAESFRAVMATAPAKDPRLSTVENLLQRAFHFEFKSFLHGFLVLEDHISMAHHLETRVPFLDNALADLAWRIPPALKLDTAPLASKGASHVETADGKRILRRAMQAFLPAAFTQQKKQGFSPPDDNWYRGPSVDYIRSVLLDKRTSDRPWFDAAFVKARLEEHFTGRRNHRLLIWSLLSVEWLQRHYVDGAPAAPAAR
jgi:asparagine synthase (glutamine-hydrolysing)